MSDSKLRLAMQWLLDDLHTAGETHDETGKIFDSVEDAAAALVEAGGVLDWYSRADAERYRRSEPEPTVPTASASVDALARTFTEVVGDCSQYFRFTVASWSPPITVSDVRIGFLPARPATRCCQVDPVPTISAASEERANAVGAVSRSPEIHRAQLMVAKYLLSGILVIGSGAEAEIANSDAVLIGADEHGPAWVRGVFFAVAEAACRTENDWLDLLSAIALTSPKRIVEVLNGNL